MEVGAQEIGDNQEIDQENQEDQEEELGGQNEEDQENDEENEENEEDEYDWNNQYARITYNTTLGKLEKLLEKLRTSSQFYSTGVRQLAMPTITIEGIGRLSFPILEVQTERLVAKAQRAPFGRGEKTVTDLSVRKVWQLPAEAVTVIGNAWKTTMDEILKTVRPPLPNS